MSALQRLLRTAPIPRAAVEVAADRVTAVALSARGGRHVVAGHASAPLPAGAVTPSLTGPNVHDRAALVSAVARALEQIGRPRRVGLVVPDPVAKVSVLHFDEAPERAADLDGLIRFQMRKSAPFSIDEAQLTWSAGTARGEAREYVVAVARRDIVAEYEGAVTDAGAYAGLVDLASFNVINAVLAGHAPAGDWLLVHAPAGYVTIAILRDAGLVFFRTRSGEAGDSLADMVHQTAMYYEDRLQGAGFGRVLLSGGAAGTGEPPLRQSLEARLGAPVEAIHARSPVAFGDRFEASPALVEALAPAVGLLVRGRDAA